MLSTKQKTILIGAVIAIIAFASISAVVAIYVMTSNPTSPVTVVAAATIFLSPSTTTLSYGGTLILTATVSDASPSLLVTFYDQADDTVGTATTNSVGVAALSFQPPSGVWIYHASATHP
jgi:hypothetical protein